MGKAKSIDKLGVEYAAAANVVEQRIAARRARLKKLKKQSIEAGIIRSELNILYRERREALETAGKLINYYGGTKYAKLH